MALPIMGFDCTMIGAGRRGGRNVAGQVSIVDETGKCVYNVFVKHKLKIRDYRTANTGITEENITNNGITYKKVKSDVASWIRHRILVGHDLNKLKVLGLCHPDWNRRDTSEYWRFRTGKKIPILSNLAVTHLGVEIQNGIQFPYQNARIAVRLYKKYQNEWDEQVEQEYADSDEEMSDEEQSDEEQSDEEYSDEEQSDEEISDEEQSDEEQSDEEQTDEEESEYSSEDYE